MNLGFSYVGLIFIAMLMVPNIIWIKNKPLDYDKYAAGENKVLTVFERIGEVAVTCTVLVFSDFNINYISLWSLWLGGAFLFMILYEAYWIRYFKSKRTMKDFYTSFMCIPVAGASLPIIAFMLLSVYGKNVILSVAVIILAIGHIGIHIAHKRETEAL